MMKIVIVGASSEIAKYVATALPNNNSIITISRKYDSTIARPDVYHMPVYSPDEINIFLGTLTRDDEHTFIFFNGIADSEIFINLSEAEIHNIINVNLVTPIVFIHACLRKFMSKRTKYIFLTSSRALVGDKGIALYSTTKSALIPLARSLALEYGKFRQFFYVISLGLFNLGLIKEVNSHSIDKILKNSAINDFVAMEELLKSIEFCISSDAATGSVIYTDNGYSQ